MKNDKNLKIVCLGGGVGTVQLIRGLREYSKDITVICSMADDGGSAGRLRRIYSVPPPGDLINCLAALSDAEPALKELLTFRFEGNRYGGDHSLVGQKLGNLILVALTKTTGNFNTALNEVHRIFSSHGRIIPATVENVSISARTIDGKIIDGEEKIDRGEYNGPRGLSHVYLEPENSHAPQEAIAAIEKADIIIAGPGDLYTTILPVLLVKDIQNAIQKSQGKKIFVVNVANKPFETPNYAISDFLTAITKHCGQFPFKYVLANNNLLPKMPSKLRYAYVKPEEPKSANGLSVIYTDLINEDYPLYHDPQKLAKKVISIVE
ncbi:YvcK family protein [Candidatus Microgenomates bacterium]|nr:YvcK family protein [Candidatus Microgenomates bacterium]